MTTLSRLRIFHACLASLAVAAYATGEAGIIHSWLGYSIAGLVVLRLVWAAAGEAQLGLGKFYPHFDGLKLGNMTTHPAISRTLLAGIALCLIGVTATGLWMDQGKAVGIRPTSSIAFQVSHDDEDGEDHVGEEMIEEVHEAFANALVAFVALHILYLLAFKRPLALFMLFIRAPHSNRRN
jgi:cytochrome b